MTTNRYRSLDPVQIVETVARLRDRIRERFPEANLVRVAEELADVATSALDQLCHRLRGRVGRVRIAEHAGPQQFGVGVDLRSGVETSARVVEVYLILVVEAAVVGRPHPGVGAVGVELGMMRCERAGRIAQEIGCELRLQCTHRSPP